MAAILRAFVRSATGRTRHMTSDISGASFEVVPRPHRVEVTEDSGLYYLLHYDETGDCIADTCHLSIDEAKRQAAFEFIIQETEWEPIVNQ